MSGPKNFSSVSASGRGIRFRLQQIRLQLVDAFCARPDAVLSWDRAAADATTEIKAALAAAGTPIGPNDIAIAGHAIAARAILVTNNTREFERVPGLQLEEWVS
ncbi:type II toxin-antitoxin system VapC family toxin [Pantoea sp. paga]|nr:type II toxin-antitoxin system VapC family toxin [Pantoea sp. paga]